MTRLRLMVFVPRKQMMAFVESGWDEGGCAIEGQAKVARVEVRPIEASPMEVRIHGE